MRYRSTAPVLMTGLTLLALPAAVRADAPLWSVSPESTLTFTALQQGSPVPGRFEAFEAAIAFDPDDLETSRINVEVDMGSVATGHDDRDQSLRSSDLFHVEAYPTTTFASNRITSEGDGSYIAHGTLTIRDVSREVALPFTLQTEAAGDTLEATAEGELAILRLDYGVGEGDWASTTMVGNEVTIAFTIDASRPLQPEPGA